MHAHTHARTHAHTHTHTHTHAHIAPSAPTDVSARYSSSTSIIVNWNTPKLIQGVITSYSITYYTTFSGEGNASTVVVDNGSARSSEIGGLMKYTEYTVFIWANTSAGGGDRSESVTVVTDEDCEFISICHFIIIL